MAEALSSWHLQGAITASNKDGNPFRQAAAKDEQAKLKKALGAVLPGQPSARRQEREQRSPAYDRWRCQHFHPGARLRPTVKAAEQQRGAPPATLVSWLDSHNFDAFAQNGSVFGAGAPPDGYEAACDESGLPWLWHARTGVAVWPVRADLGCCGTDSEGSVTLYHYTSREGMHTLTKVLFQGQGPLALYNVLLEDGGLWSERNGLVSTVLEPARYARGRDVLRDRLGPYHWPPGEPSELGRASHCLPLALPMEVLHRDAEEGRPDRCQVLDERLRARLLEEQQSLAPRARQAGVAGLGFLARLCGKEGEQRQSKPEILARIRQTRLREELAKAGVHASGAPLRLAERGAGAWRLARQEGFSGPAGYSQDSVSEGSNEESDGEGSSASGASSEGVSEGFAD